MAEYLREGKAILIPKAPDTAKPQTYIPITCLPTVYEAFSAIISQRICKHLKGNNLFSRRAEGKLQGFK